MRPGISRLDRPSHHSNRRARPAVYSPDIDMHLTLPCSFALSLIVVSPAVSQTLSTPTATSSTGEIVSVQPPPMPRGDGLIVGRVAEASSGRAVSDAIVTLTASGVRVSSARIESRRKNSRVAARVMRTAPTRIPARGHRGRRERRPGDPPAAIARHGWRYHHVGIPYTAPRGDEQHLANLRVHVCGFKTSPYGIEWMRFELLGVCCGPDRSSNAHDD